MSPQAILLTLAISLLGGFALVGCERSVPGAATVFEFVTPQPIPEERMRDFLPANDASVGLRRLPGTNLYELFVRNPDSAEAVRRTNQILDTLRDRLHNEAVGARFRIWQGARAGSVPSG